MWVKLGSGRGNGQGGKHGCGWGCVRVEGKVREVSMGGIGVKRVGRFDDGVSMVSVILVGFGEVRVRVV